MTDLDLTAARETAAEFYPDDKFVLALLDRAERAEAERDELQATYNNVWAWWMKAVERAKAAEAEVKRLASLNLLREVRKAEIEGVGEPSVRGDSDGQV